METLQGISVRELRASALTGDLEADEAIVTLDSEELRAVLGGTQTQPTTKCNTSTGITTADGTCVCCNPPEGSTTCP